MSWAFTGTLLLYLGLATALVLIVRRMATGGPGYESDGTSRDPAPDAPSRETARAVAR